MGKTLDIAVVGVGNTGLARPSCSRGQTYEFASDGRLHFHVELGHPLTGLIVRYRGWLAPSSEPRRKP